MISGLTENYVVGYSEKLSIAHTLGAESGRIYFLNRGMAAKL